ncbi:MAG: RHS repeat-associated core domain-containing protein [Candidatus Omnitrophota bacterium]
MESICSVRLVVKLTVVVLVYIFLFVDHPSTAALLPKPCPEAIYATGGNELLQDDCFSYPRPHRPAAFSSVPLDVTDALGDPASEQPTYSSPKVESLKFEGKFEIAEADVNKSITFTLRADDGVRLVVSSDAGGDQVLIDQFATLAAWETAAATRQVSFTPTQAGTYVFRIDYSNIIKLSSDVDGLTFNAKFTENGNSLTILPPDNLVPNNNVNGGEPVYLNTGDFYTTAADLRIPGRGFDFVFKRAYRSKLNYLGPLGYGWEFNYNKRIQQTGGNLILFHGYREQRGLRNVAYRFSDVYTQISSTEWNAPPGFFNKIILQPDGTYILREADGFEYHFFGFTGQPRDGKLKKMLDPRGNEMTFSYDAAGRLLDVVDTLGRIIHFTSDAAGKIIKITDFAGREVKYGYDGNADLRKVTTPITTEFPLGQTTAYAYSYGFSYFNLNHNLLTVTDHKGQTYLTNIYGTSAPDAVTFDKVTSQIYGNGILTYEYFPQELYTKLTDRNGNVIDYGYSTEGNPTFVKTYTNRDINPNDPDFFLVTFEHNSQFDLTKTVFPRGNSIEMTFDDTNPDIYQQGNLLKVARRPTPMTPDSDSLVSTFTYEPVFNQVLTTTDPRGNTSNYSYDTNGNVIAIEYPDVTIPVPQTITQTFSYNAFGQLTEGVKGEENKDCFEYFTFGPSTGYLKQFTRDCSAGGKNPTTQYTYDAVGNITSVTDPNGNTTALEVNALNQITKVTSAVPFAYETRFTYDANQNLIQVDVQNKDKDGNINPTNPFITRSYTYDILDNPTSVTAEIDETNTATTMYEFDANENLIRVIFPMGNKVRYIYDERDSLYQLTRGEDSADASTYTYTYDGNGNLSISKDGRGNEKTYSYDLFDRTSTMTDALNNYLSYTYDNNSNLIRTQVFGPLVQSVPPEVRLAELNITYDELNRAIQVDRAHFDPATQVSFLDGNDTTQYFLDRNSRLTKVFNDNSHQLLYQYDGADRLIKTIDQLTNEQQLIYDSNSNVTQTICLEKSQLGNPDETFTTTYSYDTLNRTTEVVDNIGNRFQYAYDSRSNLVFTIDAKGNTTTYAYDGLNRLLQTTHDLRVGGGAPGAIFDTVQTSQRWDKNSRLISQDDDNGNRTWYFYDALNRPIQTTFADNTRELYRYDANDNMESFVDQNGTIVSNTYDVLNRLVDRNITLAPGVTGPVVETYEYDGLSRLVRGTDDDSTVLFTYDSLSRVLTEAQNGLVVQSTYDSFGNRTGIVYPGGRVVTQQFDALERLAHALAPAAIADYSYAGPGMRVEKRSYPNAIDLLPLYDGLNRPTQLLHQKSGPATIADFRYDYDAMSNRLYEQKLHAPFSGSGDRFEYDSLYRNIAAKINIPDPVNGTGMPAFDMSYNFDGVNNRLDTTINYFGESYTMDFNDPPADSQVNQYTTIGDKNYTYDDNGNMSYSGKGNSYLFYDYRNQVVALASSVPGGPNLGFRYDVLGRRIEKENDQGQAIRSVYDGFREIEERNETGTLTATFVYGNGIDELLSMNRGGQDYFFHENALGSIMFITDSAGAVAEKYDYDSYGITTIRDPSGAPLASSAIGNPYMFTGRRFDPETQLYNYRTRLYDPAIGRFISADSIGRWTDARNLGNGFAYVGNNSPNLIDPMGWGDKPSNNGQSEQGSFIGPRMSGYRFVPGLESMPGFTINLRVKVSNIPKPSIINKKINDENWWEESRRRMLPAIELGDKTFFTPVTTGWDILENNPMGKKLLNRLFSHEVANSLGKGLAWTGTINSLYQSALDPSLENFATSAKDLLAIASKKFNTIAMLYDEFNTVYESTDVWIEIIPAPFSEGSVKESVKFSGDWFVYESGIPIHKVVGWFQGTFRSISDSLPSQPSSGTPAITVGGKSYPVLPGVGPKDVEIVNRKVMYK